MAMNSNQWQASKLSRIAAGTTAVAATTLAVMAIHLLAAYYATGSLFASAAQWAA
jgi:cytochrome b subunit of formate dehydrogenase